MIPQRLGVIVVGVVLVGAGCFGCADGDNEQSMSAEPDAELLARCGGRGAPITLATLVRIARANGLTLDVDKFGCEASEDDLSSPAATNGEPSGVEVRPEVDDQEGHVICHIARSRHADNRKVRVWKYETDQETRVSVLNVLCAVYPSDAASEQRQVARLKKALEAVARST